MVSHHARCGFEGNEPYHNRPTKYFHGTVIVAALLKEKRKNNSRSKVLFIKSIDGRYFSEVLREIRNNLEEAEVAVKSIYNSSYDKNSTFC